MPERDQEAYDAATNEVKVEVLNAELGEEIGEWQKMGIDDPNQVIIFNPMQQTMWVKSLTSFLVKKGIIDEPEFMVHFKEHMLDNLRKARQEVEPEVRKARLQAAGFELPTMEIPPGILKKH